MPFAPALVLALGLIFTHSDLDKVFMQSNAYCRQRQWAKIIDLAGRLPAGASNVYFTHALNRALYHTGRLPDEMFRFPQRIEALLLTHEDKESSLTELDLCDLFMDLGEVNAAEKLASEILVVQGNLGILLDRLALIHLAKGDWATARVYLMALRGDLVYRAKAKALLKGLDQGFEPDQAASIEEVRRTMRTDAACIGKFADQRLSELVDHNPRNRMAFEYLMACYLLTGRVDKIAANMGRLGPLGYASIPTHYEEAILLYHGLQGQPLDLEKLPVRQETIQRYMEFVRITSSLQGSLDPGLDRLGRDLKESYFFYFTFQCPGQGTKP